MGVLIPAAAARADFTVTRISVFNVDALVPDGGQYPNEQFLAFDGTVTDVDVGLVLTPTAEGAFAGDYYAALGHDTGYAVLLNRIGKTDTDAYGSGANGLDVLFDDSAPAGDVHAAPYDSESVSQPALTGTWRPDARETDPAAVTTASPRTAFLSSFNNTSTAGGWRLLVADDSTGASARLASWSLSVTYAPAGGVLPTLGASDTLTVTSGTVNIPTPRTIDAQIVNQGLIIGPSGSNDALTFTGAVTGGGDFQGNIELLGSYSPGNSPEAVTFTGDLLFGPAHVLTMEIGGTDTDPAPEYDTLHVTGDFTRDGILNIVFINGFMPAPTDFFRFFTASSFGGNFSQINYPAGFAATGNPADATGFTLSAIPEPAAFATLVALSSLASIASRRKRRKIGAAS